MAFIIIFFGILTTKMDHPYLQIGTIVLSCLGTIVLFIERISTNPDSQYLPYYAAFTIFFTIFFGLIAFKQKNNTLLINTIVFSLISFTLFLPFKDCQAYVLSIAAVFTLFFGILSHILNDNKSLYTSVGFTTACSLLMSITALCHYEHPAYGADINMNLIMAYAMSAVVFYFFIATKKQNDILFSSASFSMAFPLFFLVIHASNLHRGDEMLYWLYSWSALITISLFFLKKYFDTSKHPWTSIAICNIFAAFIIKIICEDLAEHVRIPSGTFAVIISVIYTYLTYIFIKSCNLADDKDKFQLSCFICAPITFITLAIMLHSTNEWKTMAFATEGLFLIMLWHYLKVNTVQNIGLGLMAVVTIRLLFNPYIETYYPQTQLILNWYLYTFTICAIMIFIGSYFWRDKDDPNKIPQIMRAVGGIIIFALINIEIANYFANGKGFSFNFCGGLAEAAAYTIAWSLYGAICMFNSTQQNRYPLRIGIGLISLALIKLFFSDIWMLSSGLRIIVLIGVAFILLAVSFIYQQFQKMKERVE